MSVLLNDTASWGLIVGVILPIVTALVQRPEWSPGFRRVIAVAAAIVVGILTTLANGDITSGSTMLATIAAVLVAAQASYDLVWKPTGVARKVAVATSPGRHRADRPAE